MIYSYLEEFCDALAFTSTAEATNVLDVSEARDPNLGAGTPIWLVCRVNTAFASTGSTSHGGYAELLHCSTSGGTYVSVIRSFDYSTGMWVKGYNILTVPLPPKHMRYLKLKIWSTGVSWSAGNIDAYLSYGAPRT